MESTFYVHDSINQQVYFLHTCQGERADGYVPDMGDEEEKYQRELEARRQFELSKRHQSLKKK